MGGHAVQQGFDHLAGVARAALVRGIDASGVFDADPVWREAFETVPRHLFVPSYYVGVVGGYQRRWGESADPVAREAWLRGVYEDVPLAIRMRDGELVSSSSQPSLMAVMLVALGVRDGERVLEIGTGSGYNAALLAHRMGDDDLVTTVDLDPEITESARRHLDVAGYHPVVVTGDGARGVPARAPYDRIVVTCALPSVPGAWLSHCWPGARVLAPFATGLVALTVHGPTHAEGRFLSTPAYFVPLRGANRPRGTATDVGDLADVPRRARAHDGFRFLLALTAGGIGAREAYDVWQDTGRPGRERYGLTVDEEHCRAWLDDPGGPHRWVLPS